MILPHTPPEFARSEMFVKALAGQEASFCRGVPPLYKADAQNTSVCKVTDTHVSSLQYFANPRRRVRKTVTCMNFFASRV